VSPVWDLTMSEWCCWTTPCCWVRSALLLKDPSAFILRDMKTKTA